MNLNLPDASNNTSWHELRSLHVPLSHDPCEYGSTNCFKVHESVPKKKKKSEIEHQHNSGQDEKRKIRRKRRTECKLSLSQSLHFLKFLKF